jgi:hypothetical protein
MSATKPTIENMHNDDLEIMHALERIVERARLELQAEQCAACPKLERCAHRTCPEEADHA